VEFSEHIPGVVHVEVVAVFVVVAVEISPVLFVVVGNWFW
jgi:hypothetical protein